MTEMNRAQEDAHRYRLAQAARLIRYAEEENGTPPREDAEGNVIPEAEDLAKVRAER